MSLSRDFRRTKGQVGSIWNNLPKFQIDPIFRSPESEMSKWKSADFEHGPHLIGIEFSHTDLTKKRPKIK